MKKEVTTLILDYDGVFLPDEYLGISSVCADTEAFGTLEERYFDTADCAPFWDEVRSHFHTALTNSELAERYSRENDAQRKHKQRMFDIARELAKRFTLVLLSNQIKDRAYHLRKAEDFSMFRTVYFSNEIGLKKPDAEIFQFVLDREKQRPANCLFVDDREENIRAAAKLGINVLLYQDPEHLLEHMKML